MSDFRDRAVVVRDLEVGHVLGVQHFVHLTRFAQMLVELGPHVPSAQALLDEAVEHFKVDYRYVLAMLESANRIEEMRAKMQAATERRRERKRLESEDRPKAQRAKREARAARRSDTCDLVKAQVRAPRELHALVKSAAAAEAVSVAEFTMRSWEAVLAADAREGALHV